MTLPPPRKPTPGSCRYSFVDTEEPTRPGVPKPADRWSTMAHLMENLEPDDRRRLMRLADNWFRCDANDRVMVETFADRCAR